MSEAESVIDRTPEPATVASLTRDLRALGLGPGVSVIVHASLSRLGWVCGGPVAVIEALQASVSPGGHLLMPAFTGENSEPSRWKSPPVPESWWPVVRASMPAFDPARWPARMMGRIAETFRTFPGVVRSGHPSVSIAAWGPDALSFAEPHRLEAGLGEGSPLARLYERDGLVLLLGVDHGNDSSLHLAEHRATWAGKTTVEQGAAVARDGRREWVVYEQLDYDEEDFAEIGEAFAATGGETLGRVGEATARLLRQRAVVDFAAAWMTEHRARG